MSSDYRDSPIACAPAHPPIDRKTRGDDRETPAGTLQRSVQENAAEHRRTGNHECRRRPGISPGSEGQNLVWLLTSKHEDGADSDSGEKDDSKPRVVDELGQG